MSKVNLISKLWKLKREVEGVAKKGNNPHFRSKYIQLDDLMSEIDPVCDNLKLAYTGNFQVIEGNLQVFNLIVTDLESGESESNAFILTGTDIQKIGGAITYARRYLLVAIIGLGAEDLDGEDAVGRGPRAETDEGRGSYRPEGNAKLTPPTGNPAPTRRAPFGRGGK